jgi:hypothetical protein
MRSNPRFFVGLTIALMWIAGGAVVGAGEDALGPAWPVSMGFVAVFVRFFIAPVPLHMYACAAAALVTGLVAATFSYFSVPGGSIPDVAALRAGHSWGVALLALAYGVLSGTLFAAILARMLGRQPDPETEDLLEKSDNTVFGLTTRRNTHPVLIVIAISIVITLVGFIRGWWLG